MSANFQERRAGLESDIPRRIAALQAVMREKGIGVADDAFRDCGYPVVGMHLPHCHSIGLDETDGANSSATPDDLLQEDMILAVHPGSIFDDDTAFAMSDMFRVTPDGGERQ